MGQPRMYRQTEEWEAGKQHHRMGPGGPSRWKVKYESALDGLWASFVPLTFYNLKSEVCWETNALHPSGTLIQRHSSSCCRNTMPPRERFLSCIWDHSVPPTPLSLGQYEGTGVASFILRWWTVCQNIPDGIKVCHKYHNTHIDISNTWTESTHVSAPMWLPKHKCSTTNKALSSFPPCTSFVSTELTIDNICLPIKWKTRREQKLYMGWSLNPQD